MASKGRHFDPSNPERRPRRGRAGGITSQPEAKKLKTLEKEGAEPVEGLAPFESKNGQPEHEEWSDLNVTTEAPLENGEAWVSMPVLDETLPKPVGGDIPNIHKEALVDRLMMLGVESMPTISDYELSHPTADTARRVQDRATLELIMDRLQELAGEVLNAPAEKEEAGLERKEGEKETFWNTRLNRNTKEAKTLRQEQLGRMEILLPKFIVRNVERLKDGETKIWREPATTVVVDWSGISRDAEGRLEREDEADSGKSSQQINQMISDFFGKVHNEATVAGGELLSLGGDEVVYAFFGEANQERALHFGSRVREVSQADPEAKVQLSGGIVSGDLLLGVVALDDKRSMPVVLGDTLVEARRLQGLAKRGKKDEQGEILVHSGLQEALSHGGESEKGEMATNLIRYGNIEAVKHYLATRSESQLPEPTMDNIKILAKVLSPYHRYVAEFEDGGITPNLYDGEILNMTVLFANFDFDKIHRQINHDTISEATTTNSEALDDLEQMLRRVNDRARDGRFIFEKLVVDERSKLMFVGVKGEHAANGLKLSVEARDILDEYEVDPSVGLDTGKALRGLTGPLESGDPEVRLDVIGNVANAAARLAARAGRGEILANVAAVVNSADVVHVEASKRTNQNALGLKGLRRDFKVVRIDRVENIESTLEHPSGVRAVGRETQKTLMQENFAEVVRDGKQVVETIVAEAGAGKSLLTDELLREFYHGKKREADVIKGKADEFGEGKMYGLWQAPAKRLFGIENKDLPEQVLEKVRAKLGALDLEYIQYAELFVENFGLTEFKGASEMHWPGFADKAVEVMALLMSEKAQNKPLIAVFEDTHCSDHASMALLKRVIAKTQDQQILFHIVARPEVGVTLNEKLRLGDRERKIELGPLEKEDRPDFLASQFPIDGMDDFARYCRLGDTTWRGDRDKAKFKLMRSNERLAEIVGTLGGDNPYNMRAIFRYLLNYQDIHPERINPKTGKPYQFFEEREGIYYFVDYIDDTPEKGLLKDAKNIDNAYGLIFGVIKSNGERTALKFAAKLGREFRESDLSAILNEDFRTVAKYLEHWEKLGRVERGAESYSFSHANDQLGIENVIAGVELGGRKLTNESLSREVGEYKERHNGSLEDKARLFGASDDVPKGMRYNIELADMAFARQDVVNYKIARSAANRAIKIFEKNYVLIEGDDLSEADLQENANRTTKWLALPEETRAKLVSSLVDAHIKWVKTYTRTSVMSNDQAREVLGMIEDGLGYLEQFGEELDEPTRELLGAELLTNKAEQLFRNNNINDAEQIVASLGDVMERYETDDRSSRVDNLLATYYNTTAGLVIRGRGEFESTVAIYDRALSFVGPDRGFDELINWDRIVANKIQLFERMGKLDEADELAQYLLGIERMKGYKTGEASTQIGIAERLTLRGVKTNLEDAKAILYGVLEEVRDRDLAREVAVYRVLVNVEEAFRNYDAVEDLINSCLAIMGAEPEVSSTNIRANNWKSELVFVLLLSGNIQKALRVKESIGIEKVSVNGVNKLALSDGMIAVSRGNYEQASIAFDGAEALFDGSGDTEGVALTHVERAKMFYAMGDVETSLSSLKKAKIAYAKQPYERDCVEKMENEMSRHEWTGHLKVA